MSAVNAALFLFSETKDINTCNLTPNVREKTPKNKKHLLSCTLVTCRKTVINVKTDKLIANKYPWN